MNPAQQQDSEQLHSLADLTEQHLNFVEHVLQRYRIPLNLSFSELRTCQTDASLCEHSLFLLFRALTSEYRDAQFWGSVSALYW
ncbi:unnamed protein product, partial [Amoebophrya sp. A120]|eukprot:GSA120T00005349001.1